jgi:hypothetical protein
MVFRRERGSTADLMISGSGILAIVRIVSASRLHGTPAGISAEFPDAIRGLRLHPAGGPVSRELWLYNRYGQLRFFRVEDGGIVEIGADGRVMAAGDTLPARQPAGTRSPAIPPAPVSPAIPGPCTNPGRSCGGIPAVAVPGVPGAAAGTGGCTKAPVPIGHDTPQVRDLPATGAGTMNTKNQQRRNEP